jgi:hypothetical protein
MTKLVCVAVVVHIEVKVKLQVLEDGLHGMEKVVVWIGPQLKHDHY